ncbi:hypothetical protein V1523DRAFT_167930 [Lipomyces doorenjongii]
MSSEIAVFQCTLCNHAPFYKKEKFRKHSSSRHRKAATFSFNGETFPLLVTDDNKYICPTCKAETSVRMAMRQAQLKIPIRWLTLGSLTKTLGKLLFATAVTLLSIWPWSLST